MKKSFAIFLLLSAFVSNAQNTLNNVGLTSLAPASVAYSVRQLSSSYSGPLVRIKVGASFYDVYPDASTKFFSLNSKISASIGTYNAAIAVASSNALSTIISGSTDATVSIWYDQSGNNVHVLSSNGSAKIISTGSINTLNGYPTVYFSGSNSTSYLTSTTTVNYSAQTLATVNAVVQNVASTDYISGIISTGNSGGWGLCYDPTTQIKGYWIDASGSNGAQSNENSTDAKIVTGFIGTSINSTIYVNSTLKGTKVQQIYANGAADKMNIGIRGDMTNRQFNGNISEVIMFPKNLTSAEQATLEATQTIFIPITVTITSSPSGAVCAGTSVTFTVNTTGLSSPTYQWYKNNVLISGATSATYTTTSLINSDQIYCVATAGYTVGSISPTGLIANFDAANYNTASTRWNDLSTASNHMDFYTNTSYSTLKLATYSADGGGSLILNNNDVYGKTISNTGISGNGGKTMSAWIKFDVADQDWTSIASIGSYVGGQCFEIFAQRLNSTSYQVYNHYSGGLAAGSTIMPLNTWYYVTITSNASTNLIYVNGVQVGSSTQALSTTNTPLYMGAPSTYSQGGWNYNLRGKISTLSLYNTSLSAQTILDNYNATKNRYLAGYNSNAITSTITPGPAAPLTVLGDGCINKTTLSTTSGQTSYAWYKDNLVISGATSNTYSPTIKGEYKVLVSNGTCTAYSTATTISTCAVTADGSMSILETSTTLVSKEGAKNNGKGISESGKILSKPFVFGTVTTATGRIWLDRNLGASRVALNLNDAQAYGDYYQWGRPADGHQAQYINNNNSAGFTNTKSPTSVPPNDLWIVPTDGSNDWLVTPDNTLWTGANPATNPCPTGFRIPTEAEWEAERLTWSSSNAAGAFASPLKLTLPGMLTGFGSSGATYTAKDSFGQYQTQTAYTNGGVRYFGINSGNAWFDQNYVKSHGMPCRCIKN